VRRGREARHRGRVFVLLIDPRTQALRRLGFFSLAGRLFSLRGLSGLRRGLRSEDRLGGEQWRGGLFLEGIEAVFVSFAANRNLGANPRRRGSPENFGRNGLVFSSGTTASTRDFKFGSSGVPFANWLFGDRRSPVGLSLSMGSPFVRQVDLVDLFFGLGRVTQLWSTLSGCGRSYAGLGFRGSGPAAVPSLHSLKKTTGGTLEAPGGVPRIAPRLGARLRRSLWSCSNCPAKFGGAAIVAGAENEIPRVFFECGSIGEERAPQDCFQ